MHCPCGFPANCPASFAREEGSDDSASGMIGILIFILYPNLKSFVISKDVCKMAKVLIFSYLEMDDIRSLRRSLEF
jgi:hypothetical protein